MVIKFKFEAKSSSLFGIVYRPIAIVELKIKNSKTWAPIKMLVDTGADYSLLPKWYTEILNVNLKTDCSVYKTSGIGGDEVVYLLNKKIKAKIGNMTRYIPLGFLNHNNVPPIFGRQKFLESFKVIFYKHITTFIE